MRASDGNGAGAACFPFPLPQCSIANKKRKSRESKLFHGAPTKKVSPRQLRLAILLEKFDDLLRYFLWHARVVGSL